MIGKHQDRPLYLLIAGNHGFNPLDNLLVNSTATCTVSFLLVFADVIYYFSSDSLCLFHAYLCSTRRLSRFTDYFFFLLHLQVQSPTDTIVLNSLEINIKSAIFNGNDGKTITAKNIELSASEETATLLFPEALPFGKSGYLNIEFVGEINDKMKGFYRSKYSG